MKAFTVSLNGRRLCTAGVGGDGVLTAIVAFVAGHRDEELNVSVGGLRTAGQHAHVDWVKKNLKVGDEVHVKIVETVSIDRPVRTKRRNRAAEMRADKRFVREGAKKYGWKIVKRTASSH
ncbi:MAG TPA: hypothetical protein VNK82_07020 [Terriglobales bacterium]|nr:hypothetical protein [Terriglobales bacterium]